MNNYINSEKHLRQLVVAREKARGKFKCRYCGKPIALTGLKTHEFWCYLNPCNIKICCVCDKPIKNYRHNTTCSTACGNTFFRSGENHPNWKPENYRSTCFSHHKKECIICGEVNIVEVHHFDEDKENNLPENLVPICPTHHKYYHSRYKSLVENTIIKYIEKFKEESLTVA